MDFEHLAKMVGESELDIIAAAQCVADEDKMVIKLYREYQVVKLLFERDESNAAIFLHLNNIYWKMIKHVRDLEKTIETLGLSSTSLTRQLDILNHNN